MKRPGGAMARTALAVALGAGTHAHGAFANPPGSTIGAVCLPPLAESCAPRPKKDVHAHARPPRLLATLATLVNLHTREAVVLGPAPRSREAALVARLLRDRTNWQEHEIAPGCIATIRAACVAFGAQRVEIISGYRSDKMNESLRKKGRHVAQHSQHVLGNAVDFRLALVDMRVLLAFVRRTHRGGVGFYRDSSFVHVDVGRPRFWRGE